MLSSENSAHAAIADPARKMYGLQFHPEVIRALIMLLHDIREIRENVCIECHSFINPGGGDGGDGGGGEAPSTRYARCRASSSTQR